MTSPTLGNILIAMQTVISCKLRLHATPEQTERLLGVTRIYRDAITPIWQENFDTKKSAGKQWLHENFYHPMRERFGLSAQHCINLVRETHSTFATLWSLQKKEFDKPSEKRRDHFRHAPKRKSLTMQLTMNRSVIVYPESQVVNITALDGRVRGIPFTGFHGHIEMMRSGKMGDPKLLFDTEKRRFYLIVPVTVEVPDCVVDEVVAIDVGERHMAAVVSTAGCREVIDLPKHYGTVKSKIHRLRGRLRSKGTRSARRSLRRLAERERLFTSDLLHCVSKAIVTSHPRSLIVMEDLTDIRDNRRTHRGGASIDDRREARRRAEQWPFSEFQTKVVHKHARLNGGSVEFRDPAFTSQRCPICGHTEAGNRIGDEFLCLGCGHHDHADLVAGDNLLFVHSFGPIVNRPEVIRQDRRDVPRATGLSESVNGAVGMDKPTASVVGG